MGWKSSAAATALLLLAWAAPASAQSTQDAAVLAGPCASCHGTDGKSRTKIPSLAGRPESTLAALLKSFKSETPPPGTTVMTRIANGYTDAQIEELAKFFAGVK